MRKLVLSLSALLALPLVASAATINVNSTADTLVAGDGQCTLREAVINANGDSDTTGGDCAAGSGADLINVPAGTYVIGSYLQIQSDLTLRGEDARVVEINVDGSGAVVWIGNGPWAVALERLTLTGPGEIAGGRGWGAGVLAENESGNLTISESVVYGNYGEWGPGCCTLIDAGGVFSLGRTVIRRSSIVGNLGPGIIAGGDLRVENSTVSENYSGHIWGDCWYRCRPEPVGAAIDAFGNASVSLVESTVADNHFFQGATSPRALSGVISARGSLISNPDMRNCGWGIPSSAITSGGHNIDSDGSCGLTDPTDLSNVDPMLGPLQDNGGPTPTHALLAGSPAIDRIPNAACKYDHDGDPATPEVALTSDQRGGTRPREGNGAAPMGCDVGAYEVQACADGLDNDGDGRIDFDGGATAGLDPVGTPDPQCSSALGNVEAAPPSWGCGLGPELALLLPSLWWLRRRPAGGRRHA